MGERRGDIMRALRVIEGKQKTLAKKHSDLKHEHGCLGIMYDEVRSLLTRAGMLKENT